MTSARRTGLLGGMFDPIHCGHLDVAAAAERALKLNGMLVVPSNIPPHRPQPFASSHHRFAMAAMAVAGRRGWRALDLELRQDGPSYTSDTLRRFHSSGFAPSELFFITGADAFLEIATWHDYPAVLDLAHFAVVARPGVAVGELPARLPALAPRMQQAGLVRLKADTTYEDTVRLEAATTYETCIFLIEAVTADVSSTAIRRARRAHESIAGWVPLSVQQHIEQHALYEDPTPTAGTPQGSLASAAGRLHGQD
jgi:nicotinate-nucleotide adenylyltransferase